MSSASMTSAFAAKHQNGEKLKGDRIIVDLQSPHRVLSPAETMRSLATSCEELGIDSFDIYGDFAAGAFYVVKSNICINIQNLYASNLFTIL